MNRIRVGHICEPGVWKRAPLITPDGRKATASHDDPTLAYATHDVHPHDVHPHDGLDIWPITSDWHVCLDDSRGLGLAGLAATVAQRLGWTTIPVTPMEVTGWLHEDRPEWLELVLEGIDSDCPVPVMWARQLCAAATYLRLTDDLCKANDVPRQEHEVATWTRGVDSEGAVTWSLGVQSCDYEYTWRFDVDEWQTALEAVLAEVSHA